jgi:outer membrane protein
MGMTLPMSFAAIANKIAKVAVLFAATITLGLTSFAADAKTDIKIGFVDRERILRESGAAKRAQAKLKREFQAREAELEKLEKQGRDLQTTLQKESVTLTEADRAARERQLAQLERDFKRLQRELREDQTLRSNEELVSLQERANKIISEIADKEKFDLIVQEAVFASARIDITDKVIKALGDK